MSKQFEALLSRVKAIEEARRARRYAQMYTLAMSIVQELRDENTDEIWRIRSRITYELHMARYQLAMESDPPNQEFLRESMAIAGISAEEARRGHDPAGALHAEMNISGLLMPALGRWAEGMMRSRLVGLRADAFATESADESERSRLLKVAMNTYFHRIRITMEHGLKASNVEELLEQLDKNLVYQQLRNETWAIEAIEKARAYVASTS